MLKSEKKLSKAKKSCIKFGTLSALNLGLGITGIALASSALLSLVSVASLGMAGVWGVLAYKGATLDKHKKKIDKKTAKKEHKLQYKQAYKKKKEKVKEINKDYKNNLDKTKAQRKEEKQAALNAIPKSAKPYKFWKVTSIIATVLCSLVAAGSAVALADNFITASTLASEANKETAQYIKRQSAINTGIGIGIAGASTVGLVVAAIGANKMAKKREDEIIEANK